MHRAVGLHVWSGLLAVAVFVTACLPSVWGAAQALSPPSQLVSAEPMPNARLSVAPEQIALIVATPIAADSARMRLFAAGAVEIPLHPAEVVSARSSRMAADVAAPIGRGDYTVVWSAQALDGGALLGGAYPFAVGVDSPPGGVDDPRKWPEPWAALVRWTMFLGTAIASGGFVWERILVARRGRRTAGRGIRLGGMAGAAIVALLATALTPVLVWSLAGGGSSALASTPRAMPMGWWVQGAALTVLVFCCVAAFVTSGAIARSRAPLDVAGIAAGAAALAGLGFSSHAASSSDGLAMALEVGHLWAAALWSSGVVFFLAGWRGLGTDVARFRTVRWTGGLLLAGAAAAGVARASQLFPTVDDLGTSRYGEVLLIKVVVVLVVAALGGAAMLGAAGANAVRASRSLGAQAAGAGVVALLAAVLALLAPPGTSAPATLAGVALADVVALDQDAFGAGRGVIHLLTQPAERGAQTVVVRFADGDGRLLAAPEATAEVTWSALDSAAAPAEPAALVADASGAMFIGAATLGAGWHQADVAITPPGGIASRAQFWLVVPDPNVTGAGPEAASDPEAMALYERGMASLTSLQSVRYTRRVGDGSGNLTQTQVSVSAADGERPAAYAETVVGQDEETVARQVMVGNRRWVLEDGDWAVSEPVPFLVPAAWGEAYIGAGGFQFGPREAIDGELCQVVLFQTPVGNDPTRDPAWHAWWVGLASGQVRREAMVSTRHYAVTEYRDFNAPLDVQPPPAALAPASASPEANRSPEP